MKRARELAAGALQRMFGSPAMTVIVRSILLERLVDRWGSDDVAVALYWAAAQPGSLGPLAELLRASGRPGS